MQGCEETDPSIARYDVNVHVAIGSHPFASSKLVTFAPAVVLCNASNATMNVQQYHSNKLLTLQPGSSRPLIWFNPDAKSELLVQPVCEGVLWNWSGRFTVSEVCTHALRIHSKNDPSHFTILPVSVSMQVSFDLSCTLWPQAPWWPLHGSKHVDAGILSRVRLQQHQAAACALSN